MTDQTYVCYTVDCSELLNVIDNNLYKERELVIEAAKSGKTIKNPQELGTINIYQGQGNITPGAISVYTQNELIMPRLRMPLPEYIWPESEIQHYTFEVFDKNYEDLEAVVLEAASKAFIDNRLFEYVQDKVMYFENVYVGEYTMFLYYLQELIPSHEQYLKYDDILVRNVDFFENYWETYLQILEMYKTGKWMDYRNSFVAFDEEGLITRMPSEEELIADLRRLYKRGFTEEVNFHNILVDHVGSGEVGRIDSS